jgi:aspartyl-tRNA(Asn)/glutamyl-tRNA(Gln) amidotransferase subunit B
MEEGSLRCDANVSIMLKGATEFGAKVEVKNMNSIRNVKRAIEHEFVRQAELLEKGEKIHQDTRSFDASTGTTFSMRSKEMAHDYRYFPEPDLPPMIITKEEVARVNAAMPELPNALKQRYINEYHLSEYDAAQLTDDKLISLYFEKLAKEGGDYKAAANWIIGPVKSYLNKNAVDIEQYPLAPERLAELIHLIADGKTNFTIASTKLLPEMLEDKSSSALAIAEKLNLIQSSDSSMITAIADEVLAAFPEKVAEFKDGKKGLMGLFVGEVMKRSGGKADPKLTNQILTEKLN